MTFLHDNDNGNGIGYVRITMAFVNSIGNGYSNGKSDPLQQRKLTTVLAMVIW